MLNCACWLYRPGRAWIERYVALVCLSVCLSVCSRSKRCSLAAAEGPRAHARSVEILSTTAKLSNRQFTPHKLGFWRYFTRKMRSNINETSTDLIKTTLFSTVCESCFARVRVGPNLQFYTKCAVLTEHLCS